MLFSSRFISALALFALTLAISPSVSAQNDFLPTGPSADGSDNENQRIRSVPDTPGAYEFAYWARLGRTYFTERSIDLVTWEYFPVIETGRDAAVGYGFTSDSPRVFVRLRHIAGTFDDPYSLDLDGDGLTNHEEFQHHSSPFLVDTDFDGIDDKTETGLLILHANGDWEYLQPDKADSDGNGVPDQLEDYDLDGLTIAQELVRGTNPNKTDSDKDGVSDGKEVGIGTNPLYDDHFADHDSDGDGLNDLEEIIHGTDRNKTDTNENGMPDGQEFDLGGAPAKPGPPPDIPPPDLPISNEPPLPPPPSPPAPPPAPPSLSPSGHRVLVREAAAQHVKHGFATYLDYSPPKRFLIETLNQQFSGGCPESGPVKTSGEKVTEIDPDTGASSMTGDDYVTGGGDIESPVVRRGVEELDGYDDPPNEEDDCPGPLAVSSRLTKENTTKMLKDSTKAKLPAYPELPPPNDGFHDGTPPYSYRILSADELGYSYQRMQVKLAWPAGTPTEARHSITYLVIFEPLDNPATTDIDESAHSEVVDTWTWNGDDEQSKIWDLDPDDLDDTARSGRFYLLPLVVEILNQDKQPVSELKVAKMSEPGVLSGSGSSTALNIDLDPDRLHVRLPGGGKLGNVTIKVATTDNPDSTYDDDPSPLQMHADSDDLITDSLLLVADNLDDDHLVDGASDDEQNDRTHKIQLGGKFRVTEVTPSLLTGAIPVDIHATVPVRLTYTCNIFVMKAFYGDQLGWEPATGSANPWAEPLDRFRIAQERWAQAGIKLVLGRQEIIQPTDGTGAPDKIMGQKLAAGIETITLNPGGFEDPKPDAKTIIDKWGTVGTTEIDIFYLPLMFENNTSIEGRGFYPAAIGPSNGSYANTIFMAANALGNKVVMAHEFGHLFTNRGHFGESTASSPRNYRSDASAEEKARNLMAAELPPNERGFGGNRRITQEQQSFTP